MAVVNNLVYDFVNQHKVLSDTLLIEHSAVVTENFHHAINDVEDSGRSHVGLARSHEVNSKFLREEIVHAIHMLLKTGGKH